MDWLNFHTILITIQHTISFLGILIIFSGIIFAILQFLYFILTNQMEHGAKINIVRLNLSRVLILGLEFIVAADLIGTTTAPDYYSVGILGIIVLIRTVLNYSINRDIQSLMKDKAR